MSDDEKKACPWGGCNGTAKPGEKCPLCGTRIPRPTHPTATEKGK
jgi:hypothetical protein